MDSQISLDEVNRGVLSKRVRISSEDPKNIQPVSYIPIATDGTHIYYKHKYWEFEDFLNVSSTDKNSRFIVLTTKEYFSIVDKIKNTNLSVTVFEIAFPLFDDVKYNSSLRTNFNVLNKLLKKIGKYAFVGGSLSRDQSTRHLRLVAKHFQYKNGFDRFFFLAYHEGYREVFRLKEERPNRKIISFDFNSMFGACMQGQFCKPDSLYYSAGIVSKKIESLNQGIYHVVFKGAKAGFFQRYHPFIFKRLLTGRHFNLKVGDDVEIILHRDEIICYQEFFDSVYVIAGVCSTSTVAHPLAKAAVSLYKRRKVEKARGNLLMANFCKKSIQFMHSSTNQRKVRKKSFDCLAAAISFISHKYKLNVGADLSPHEIQMVLKNNGVFKIEKVGTKVMVSYLDVAAPSCVFSLSSAVLSNSRIKMTETIKRFLNYQSVEICYVNIDSIHISIDSNAVDDFLNGITDLLGDSLGVLKIQAIADQGYWFDVGRYWLMRGGKVVMFRNKNFNHRGAVNPFVRKRKIFSVTKSEAFTHTEPYTLSIENTFSYNKRLKSEAIHGVIDYERYSYRELEHGDAINAIEALEILRVKRTKLELFEEISKIAI